MATGSTVVDAALTKASQMIVVIRFQLNALYTQYINEHITGTRKGDVTVQHLSNLLEDFALYTIFA